VQSRESAFFSLGFEIIAYVAVLMRTEEQPEYRASLKQI
jgi:hypothetical protein